MYKLSIFSAILFAFLAIGCKNEVKQPSVSDNSTTDTSRDALIESGNQIDMERFSGETVQTQSILNEADFTPRQVIQNKLVNIDQQEVRRLRDLAKSEIGDEWKLSNKEAFTNLTLDLFEYQALLAGESMSKPGKYDGYWINFEDDLTYSYGHNNKIQGSGIYNFKVDNQRLVILDNDKRIKPQSFSLRISGDVIIFIGGHEYKDNNMQGKMSRIEKQPSK